jgi:hypothetical protein
MCLAFPAWALEGKRRLSQKVKDEADDERCSGSGSRPEVSYLRAPPTATVNSTSSPTTGSP